MVTLVGWPEGLSKLSPNVHEKIANADYIRKMKWIWSIFKNCPTIWAKNVVKALKWSRSSNKSSNMVTYLGGGILTRELGPIKNLRFCNYAQILAVNFHINWENYEEKSWLYS